jgi:hypothetical protein
MGHKIDLEVPDISFVTIATGRYLDFWKDQLNSARIYLDKQKPIEFIILTDQVDGLMSQSQSLLLDTNWTLKVAHAPHQEWPFPTLYKFKYIVFNSKLFTGRIVWHLDADMLFSADNIESELILASRSSKMIFVLHPGYYRSKGMKRIFFYVTKPAFFFRDVRTFLFEGGLGTWERDKQSLAYVQKKNRAQYVCGGSWGGEKDIFLKFSRELANRIDQDLESEIVARFHDESHINWYRANHLCSVLDSSYCFEESYRNLRYLEKKIVAVNKSETSVWQR